MYLKIENPGVCPVEGFTLLGVTSKRDTNLIGSFGSGTKHSAGVLLRAELPPTIFCSNHKLEFGTKKGKMAALEGDTNYDRMIVKHGGKAEDGTSVTYTEELSQTQDYGILDWKDNLGMALREFVSNAIDAATTFNSVNGINTVHPWDGVVVEVVEDKQVRAKKGHTRVFVPMNGIHSDAIFAFRQNLGKWFLHFSEPESLKSSILQKKNRNIQDKQTSVIYRRGVRVREISSWSTESLFDYNLDNLRMDESRNVDDYACQAAAAQELANADVYSITKLLGSFMTSNNYWEHEFSHWDLRIAKDEVEKDNRWEKSLNNLGLNTVLVQSDNAGMNETLVHKGFKPISVPEAYIRLGDGLKKVRTAAKILSSDDREGRKIFDPTPDAIAATDWAWKQIEMAGMTKGKDKPPVKCFISLMDGGTVLNGFYRDGGIYLNQNLSGTGVEIRTVALEEICHFLTNSLDGARDFQQFAFDFAVRLAMVKDGELPTGN